ncbi:MAG: hypothetical protein ACOYKJ_04055 [Candidatus Howiella sp.]|jgi:hypothetical protein
MIKTSFLKVIFVFVLRSGDARAKRYTFVHPAAYAIVLSAKQAFLKPPTTAGFWPKKSNNIQPGLDEKKFPAPYISAAAPRTRREIWNKKQPLPT